MSADTETEPLPTRADDCRPARAEAARVAATPSLAAGLRALLADPWVARLSARDLRIYMQLCADADEHGRVLHHAGYIVLRALWADMPNDQDARHAGDHRGGCPWEDVWPETRATLVDVGLIEVGQNYVYVTGLAPEKAVTR